MTESEGSQQLNSTLLKLRQRLEFIEFRLYWTGKLNRSDLSDVFRISPPQASNDIARYQELAPNNLAYDSALKGYVRTRDFTPVLIGASIDRFLLQVLGVAQGWLRIEDTWFDELPPVEVVALDRPPTDSEVLRQVLDAIRSESEIEMDYSSMTGSPAMRRFIAPHALGAAGGRWYVRAWSREHNDFRDYALARVSNVKQGAPRTIDSSSDFEWQQKIDLVLIPNPELDEDRRRAQKLEHKMEDGELRVPCRLSMAFYLMAEHKLDVEPGKLTALQQPLILKNFTEVKQAREITRELAKQALRRAEAR